MKYLILVLIIIGGSGIANAKNCNSFFQYKETQRVNIPHGVYWWCGNRNVSATELCSEHDAGGLWGVQDYNPGPPYSYDNEVCQPNWWTISATTVGGITLLYVIVSIVKETPEQYYFLSNFHYEPYWNPVNGDSRIGFSIKW